MTTVTESTALPEIEVVTDRAEPRLAVPSPKRPYLDLFLISFLILFFELAAIRWFGSTVVFLTFFTNIVLLATFLGMSVGLLAAGRRQNFILWVLPLTFLAVALAMITFNLYMQYWNKVTIGLGNQTTSPQLIYFGTEYRPEDPSRLMIPLWAVGGVFFTLVALIFVGLGQTMGRAFDAIPNRVLAYTADVLGSLSGIAAFAAMSHLQTTPHMWFFIIVLILIYFVRRWTFIQVLSAVGVGFLIAMSAFGAGQDERIFWSPYYKVVYDSRNLGIDTNNIAHQQMIDITKEGPAYVLPHLLNRDAGGPPFEKVMIIGAGSGNDVAAALHMANLLNVKGRHVDAVEIDPQINMLGRLYHPNRPYDDKDVTIHLTDGRRFTRRPIIEPDGSERKYDLAVYALVDSLVLHSGYSSLRLENFLFTEQAFKDIKARLKPGGVFAMYNYYRQGWVVERLKKMAQTVFDAEPIVISLSDKDYQEEIKSETNEAGYRTFLLVGTDSARLEAIRKQFEGGKKFWLNRNPAKSEPINGFRELAPDDSGKWQKIGPARVDTSHVNLIPTDNWPQLYLKDKRIPWAPTGQGMVTIGVLSLVILIAFSWPVWFGPNRSSGRFNGQMFFLGAGFMLLETKGVVHMALLFGSTWVVNSVVFFAILVMILIANLYVLAIKPNKLWPYYALLAAGLLVNALVPMDWFLSLSPTVRTFASCAVVFVPVFFAGVIFATSFRDSRNPDIDFGSNVAGIILGGLSEQLSLMIGFNYLLLVAIGYYALSMILRPRRREVEETVAALPEIAAPA